MIFYITDTCNLLLNLLQVLSLQSEKEELQKSLEKQKVEIDNVSEQLDQQVGFI